MTYDQYVEVIDYLNGQLVYWWTKEMEEREWTWAEVGFLASALGFKFGGEQNA